MRVIIKNGIVGQCIPHVTLKVRASHADRTPHGLDASWLTKSWLILPSIEGHLPGSAPDEIVYC